jgi:hypothetical protein
VRQRLRYPECASQWTTAAFPFARAELKRAIASDPAQYEFGP